MRNCSIGPADSPIEISVVPALSLKLSRALRATPDARGVAREGGLVVVSPDGESR